MFFWNRRRTSLQDEIAEHIALEIEENIEAGMPPEEARIAAQKKFGNVPLALDRSREAWGLLWLEYLLQDLRYALRTLKKSPGYTLTVVLTLALGLGATATILAVVDSVLLQPAGFPHPKQLVVMYGSNHQRYVRLELSYPQIQELQKNAHLFQSVNAFLTGLHPVGTQAGMRSSMTIAVTPQLFGMLGVHAELGRLFRPADAYAARVVVSDAFWRERLHGNPKVIGSALRFDNKLQTIIGVLPPAMAFPDGMTAPAVYTPINLSHGGSGMLALGAMVMARLKPGVSRSQALAEADSILRHFQSDNVAGRTLAIQPYQQFVTGPMQKPLLVLLGGVGILLLIACTNATSLQLSRAMERMAEMHVRSALGAGFGRLLLQLLTESMVVSLSGALLGAVFAYGATSLIRAAYQTRYARFEQVAMHPAVFAILVLLAVVAGILASLAPAWQVRRQTMAAKVTPRTTSRNRVASLLVVSQIALTCVLLVVTGLFVRTFHALQQVNFGFDPHHLTTLVLMPQSMQISTASLQQADARLLSRLESLPGVESAALHSSVPFSRYSMTLTSPTFFAGEPSSKQDVAMYTLVSSSIVRTSRIAVLKGRGFLAQDDRSPDKVALVNQAFAQKYLAGRNPIGLTFHNSKSAAKNNTRAGFTIVGVVQNQLVGSHFGRAALPHCLSGFSAAPARLRRPEYLSSGQRVCCPIYPPAGHS